MASSSATTASACSPRSTQLADRRPIERFEPEQRRTAAQRRVDLEERVLGRRADERQRAVFDRRQERVLLRLGEAVDLVEEQDRALSALAEAVAGVLDGRPDVLHAGVHRRELLEGACRAAGDRESKRGLAGPGRTPEQHRRQPVALDQRAQRPARADEVLLADDVVERAWPQPCGERRRDRSGAPPPRR